MMAAGRFAQRIPAEACSLQSNAVTRPAFLARLGDTIATAFGSTAAAGRSLLPDTTAVDPEADPVGRAPDGRDGETITMFTALPIMADATVARSTPAAELDWFANAASLRAFTA